MCQQGIGTFAEAVRQIVLAHREGQTWAVRVRDKRGWRAPNETEGARLVAAATKELA